MGVNQIAVIMTQLRQLIGNFFNFHITRLPGNIELWQLGIVGYSGYLKYYRNFFLKTFDIFIECFPLDHSNNNVVSNVKTLY